MLSRTSTRPCGQRSRTPSMEMEAWRPTRSHLDVRKSRGTAIGKRTKDVTNLTLTHSGGPRRQ
jgi:hypothetical protein